MRNALIASVFIGTFAGSTVAEEVDLQSAVQAYGAAWASRDVASIVDLHTEDSEFRIFVDGMQAAIGQEAIAQQVENILQSNPTYASAIDSIRFGDDFVVITYRIRMDPTADVRLGTRIFAPTGAHYEVNAIDVIEFENGLVSLKHTFLDTEALHNFSPTVTSSRQD